MEYLGPQIGPADPIQHSERIPTEIFHKIVEMLPAEGLALVRRVSKIWKETASEDRFWARIIHVDASFYERVYRCGYPFREMQIPLLMESYGLRRVVPSTVIVDGGSEFGKYGWSNDDAPMGRSQTYIEQGNYETAMLAKPREFYATVYERMGIEPSTQPIVVSLPIYRYDDTEYAREVVHNVKDGILNALFDLDAPAVCVLSQATLALFAARKTSGIVINFGYHKTSVVPIVNGIIERKIGVESVNVGARDLNIYLGTKMLAGEHYVTLDTTRVLKEELCYVAANFATELLKEPEEIQAQFEYGGNSYILGQERFETGEILFDPGLANIDSDGVHHAVVRCINKCVDARLGSDDKWYKSLILAGGTASLTGLRERLEEEVQRHLRPAVGEGLHVICPPRGADSAWYGAKIISNVSTFPGPWCITKEEFMMKQKIKRLIHFF